MELGEDGWRMFEAYTRNLMVRSVTVECRICCGLRNSEYESLTMKKLGGCSDIRLTTDIVQSALDPSNIVFHSSNRSFELVDFTYLDALGHIHAFQVTIGMKHSAKHEKMIQFCEHIKPKRCSFYYLVPDKRFQKFVTSPVNPLDSIGQRYRSLCDIWHVHIADPNAETSMDISND
jgi:hypothetical protein